MSYCVECGVKLASSEKKCPLCGTPVLNPNVKDESAEPRPYPAQLEHVARRIDRRYGVSLAMLILMIPMAVCLISDLSAGAGLTWSAYVLGAGACLYVFVLLPLSALVSKPYLYISADAAAVALYLLLIAYMNDGLFWYAPLALPLTVQAGVFALLWVHVARRKRLLGLNKGAVITFLLGIYIAGVEMIIDRYLTGVMGLHWSVYVLVSLTIIAAAFALIESRQSLKDAIRRRLYL